MKAFFPTGLAVAAGSIAVAEQAIAPSTDSSPTTTISVRDAERGTLLRQFVVTGTVESLAKSASRVAALVRRDGQLRIEVHGPQGGDVVRSAPVPGASSLSIAGERIIFRTGRTIHLFDIRSGRTSLVATAASTPIGLSIEGTRLAWAENTRKGGRIRVVTLRRG